MASICDCVGRDRVSPFWKSSIPSEELRYGVCVQGLHSKDCHDQRHPDEHAWSCERVAQVCTFFSFIYYFLFNYFLMPSFCP